MTVLLGIDCSTDPQKTGLALGELRDPIVHISHWDTGRKGEKPEDIAKRIVTDKNWLLNCDSVLIALDAPLGWPQALGVCLKDHRAGNSIPEKADKLFRRLTDDKIKERLGKRPLEVGANLIARTAVAALVLLDEIRRSAGRSIPLAWNPVEPEPWRAIEVYPAATRIAHGAPDHGGKLDHRLDQFLTYPEEIKKESEHEIDAAVCALAAGDFLRGQAVPPHDDHEIERAKIEGWIWAPPKFEEQPT